MVPSQTEMAIIFEVEEDNEDEKVVKFGLKNGNPMVKYVKKLFFFFFFAEAGYCLIMMGMDGGVVVRLLPAQIDEIWEIWWSVKEWRVKESIGVNGGALLWKREFTGR